MPRGKSVGNFSSFLTQMVGSLNRFHKSGSLLVAGEFPNPFELRSTSELRIEIPSRDVYSEIRAKWKARDYANLPLKGLCLLDEEQNSHSSIVTVRFVCKVLGKLDRIPYPAELDDAVLKDANQQAYGFISEYSYSFYPDMLSKRAREIGYLRFDFHPDVMGDGDTGGHPYFHLHSGASGEEAEEQEIHEALKGSSREGIDRIADKEISEIRLPSPLMMPESLIKTLEYSLAPQSRRTRIEKAVSEMDWYYLMLDLTPHSLKKRMIDKFGQAEWERQIKSEPAMVAMKRTGWHLDLF